MIKIKQYNFEVDSLSRRERSKLLNKKKRGEKYIVTAEQVEILLIKLKQLKVIYEDIDLINAENSLLVNFGYYVYRYLEWVKNKIKEYDFNPMNFQLKDNDKHKINSMIQLVNIIRNDNNVPTIPKNQTIFVLNSNSFGPSFIEEGLKFYILYLDPMGFWFSPNQLFDIFKDKHQNQLANAILLYILRFTKSENINNSNQIRQLYYNNIKLNLSNIYLNPNLNNLLILIMLLNYEASRLRLNKFKCLLSSAIKMAQILNYHNLAQQYLLNNNNLNNNDNKIDRRIEIWFKLVINCKALSSMLGEGMLNCIPKDPIYLKLVKEYNESPFIIMLVKPNYILEAPIMKESLHHFKRLLIVFERLNYFHAEWKMLFENISFKELVQSFDEISTQANFEMDNQFHRLRESLLKQFQLLQLLDQSQLIAKFISQHHYSRNWLSVAPLYLMGFYPLILFFPINLRMKGICAVDWITVAPILELFYKQFVTKWIEKLFYLEELTN